eukprot:scaffold249199_cov27-Tisochrysis_lutea.AAC.3
MMMGPKVRKKVFWPEVVRHHRRPTKVRRVGIASSANKFFWRPIGGACASSASAVGSTAQNLTVANTSARACLFQVSIGWSAECGCCVRVRYRVLSRTKLTSNVV